MHLKELKFSHYSKNKMETLDFSYCYQKKTPPLGKPDGLWISVDGDQDWHEWCIVEEFNLSGLAYRHQVILKETANILFLDTAEMVIAMRKRYPYLREQWNNPEGRRLCSRYEIDWDKVKEEYEGIIIAPYQWGCRMPSETMWYYGWDCASGCIWDLNAIAEFKFVEDLPYNEEINTHVARKNESMQMFK